MMCSINERARWGVTDLRLAFPKQKEMHFKDLTFRYTEGEKILLLGPSGCGKSTLLQVLSGLIPGSVPMAIKAKKKEVPTNWGFIFQDPETQFCMPYVDEDIAFVLENRKIAREKMPDLIHHYLNLVGLDFLDPHQLIHSLSGGMKQRLAIAGVLALEPDILFLDEPTALLDPQGTEAFWQSLQKVSNNRTLVIVEHKIDRVIEFVDRVVLFGNDGTIIDDGPKERVLKQQKKRLVEDGIWYPGTWRDHLSQSIQTKQLPDYQSTVLTLDRFSVKRNGQIKCSIESLMIKQGEWVAVIGKNGAGKSTLLEGLMRLLPTKGKCIWNLTHPEEEVGFVFQNPEFQFVTDRVDDELAFSLRIKQCPPDLIHRRVCEMLDKFSLESVRGNHPFQLSIGQKRRLSVATALMEQPQVLLLDEPTFGQDAKNTFQLLDQLYQLQQLGTTIIMVTHELEIVRHYATHVLEIDAGRLVANKHRDRGSGSEVIGIGHQMDEGEKLVSRN